MKNLTLALMIALTSVAAQAGCEDGSSTAEHEAKVLMSKKDGTSPSHCTTVWMEHVDDKNLEVHYVDVMCDRVSGVVKVKLREIEDAVCTTVGASLAAPKPKSLKSIFPEETTDFADTARFQKLRSVDASRLVKARSVPEIYNELLDLTYGREMSLREMAQYDGFFTQWIDKVTGLVFWHVGSYPGDNEYGAIIEVWADHAHESTELRKIASVGDSWITWN